MRHHFLGLLVIGLLTGGLGSWLPSGALSHASEYTTDEGGEAKNRVRLNQVGFYPGAQKKAIVTGAPPHASFYVLTLSGADTVQSGSLGPLRAAPLANMRVRRADFSELEASGRYVVAVPGVGRSHAFAIRPHIHRRVAQSALKGFYYQRASTPLLQRYAGRWRRAAGHPDTTVRVHPSAASKARPAGTRLSAPGGWYDAGDYNKYVVNGSVATATLLSLYEDQSAYADTLEVDIPEAGNSRPDVLDEALWNLRWILHMQAPDGGVYHKLTAPNFEGMEVRPADASSPRYMVQKSTAATLDYAAVMAQAARIFRVRDAPPPVAPDSLVAAARNAWEWAREHPNAYYEQRRLNRRFDPDIQTGAYGDTDLQDEFVWAATELYATTGEQRFVSTLDTVSHSSAPVPSWSQVRTLGYFTLLRLDPTNQQQSSVEKLQSQVRELVLAKADSLIQGADTTAFHVPMGSTADDFVWGSNAVAANQGLLLTWAYRLTGARTYLDGALANLDYLLGRNATGYAFVTGVGEYSPQNPHHRPSVSDGVDPPVPGLLVGGPNSGQQDECEYPSDAPARSYTDTVCSYASNEIAINWNAPLAYLAAATEAPQYDAGYAAGEPSSP